MVYPDCCLHLVEASSQVIMELLRELSNSGPAPLLIDVRVLVSSEDVPERAFPFWASRLVGAARNESFDSATDQVEELVADTYLNVLKIGSRLSTLPKTEINSHLDNLRKNFREAIPHEERLAGFIESDKAVALDVFLDIYDAPVDLKLESDLTWPLRSASSLTA